MTPRLFESVSFQYIHFTHLLFQINVFSAVGYGGIDKGGFNDAIPPAYWQYAYQFAGKRFHPPATI